MSSKSIGKRVILFLNRRWIKIVVISSVSFFLLFMLIMYIVVPNPLFDASYSPVLYSRSGELLGARVAVDGQWRFPIKNSLPEKYTKSLITFEDKRFYYHLGVDIFAIGRALKMNMGGDGIKSGGSTITMQCARLARGNRDRNFYEKLVEMCWAVYIELTYTKEEILNLYAAHAPFGGNVVGMESASWRYFGRDAALLSWAESATLAVLPNSPALIHPGRNRSALKEKRDRLLIRLNEKGYMTEEECELAIMEPIPDSPLPLPNDAPHLLARLAKGNSDYRIETTLEGALQRQIQSIVDRYALNNKANQIHNLAAIVVDVKSGEVLAYSGNVSFKSEERYGNHVDVIVSSRSTGSTLKPFLYAAMLNDGLILPSTLIPDTPLNIGGFTPQNYSKTFSGAVPAHVAIERSLNVPLVRMLSQYNTGRFLSFLKSFGMTTLPYSEDHYGASLVLGGAEGSLWDIAGMYASMSRILNHYRDYNGRYDKSDVRPLTISPQPDREPITSITDRRLSDNSLLSAASVWFTYEAMSKLNRPEEEAEWQQFSSMKRIAWKTGTSYGGRDGWAVGTTPQYVVGVWVGNASGEGRPGLTGVGYAAPVLFDIFSLLQGGRWFSMPYDELTKELICLKSGYRASPYCDDTDSLYIPLSGAHTALCPFHKVVHLTSDGRYRVNSSCEAVENMVETLWFVLPPSQEYYYKSSNTSYRTLPPLKPGCEESGERQLDIIYPDFDAILYLPRGFSGEHEKFVFRAVHTRNDATLYWHLNDTYLGETTTIHQISCAIGAGKHTLIIVDGSGNRRSVSFEVRSQI